MGLCQLVNSPWPWKKAERTALRSRIEKKAAYLQELEEQFIGLRNLVQRNRQSRSIPWLALPFLLVQHLGAPLKIKRLARDPERFLWAVGIAQSRCTNLQLRVGALIQDTNMLVPYADMLNHSFQPNCFLHWRFKDRMLEVMINAGQRIQKGDEMTINYMAGQNHMLMERYGFSLPTNPWDEIPFSGNSKIHLDSFLSAFSISGLPNDYYYNSRLSEGEDTFVDGAILAAARTLPTWSDGDMPPIPSLERKAVLELQEECQQFLAEFPTTAEHDQQILDSNPQCSRTLEAAIRYRMHRKMFIQKINNALELYLDRILF